jgi:hypothetical protein
MWSMIQPVVAVFVNHREAGLLGYLLESLLKSLPRDDKTL